MTLTLILTRHAKSSWDDPLLDDFERPLNGRGRRSASSIARWLVGKGHLPDKVVVSGARRTVETWENMAPVMPETATMESTPALYHAGSDVIFGVARSQSARSMMVICHNPGIASFARQIVSTAPAHPDFSRYPTCATAVMEFQADNWNDLAWGSGEVVDFVVPRELD